MADTPTPQPSIMRSKIMDGVTTPALVFGPADSVWLMVFFATSDAVEVAFEDNFGDEFTQCGGVPISVELGPGTKVWTKGTGTVMFTFTKKMQPPTDVHVMPGTQERESTTIMRGGCR